MRASGASESVWGDEPVRCCLDAIGVRHGTELSSLGRDCLAQWERFLEPLREEAIDLLEIGVGSGASLRTWREWFPLARLVGLEARRVMLESSIAGCTIVQGSQTDFEVLRRILLNRRFRLIIDDGSRHVDDQVQTFLTLFPWLEPASVYICATFPDHAGADAAASPGSPPWGMLSSTRVATGRRATRA